MANDQFSPAAQTAIVVFIIASMVIIALAALAFWIWMLVDCLTNEQPGSSRKVGWGVAIVVFGLFGAFVYNVSRRKQRIRELGH